MQISFNCGMHCNGQVTRLKIEEQEDKMLNLESTLGSRLRGDLVPEPKRQTLPVLAGVQEEQFEGYEDNRNTIFSVVDLAMGQLYGEGAQNTNSLGLLRWGAAKHPQEKPSNFVQAKPGLYEVYGVQKT